MPTLHVAGFWRRAAAFLIDMLLLGVVGWIAGVFFFDAFAKLGSYGRTVGFLVAMAYFVPFDSRLGNGQTLGKRILGVQVANAQGQCLSVPRALMRYVVIGVPFFLNGFFSTSGWNSTLAKYIVSPALSLIVFGGLLSLIYLYIFNRRTRQSLHDLAVGSYVIRVKNTQPAKPLQVLWRIHVVVVGVIALLSLTVPVIVATRLKQPEEQLTHLLPAWQQLSALPNVHHAQVSDISNIINNQKTHYVAVTLWLDTPNTNDKTLAENAARIAAAHDDTLTKKDSVLVQLSHGYDIGISSFWRSQSYQFKLEELQTPR